MCAVRPAVRSAGHLAIGIRLASCDSESVRGHYVRTRPVEVALQLTDLPDVAIQAIAKQLPPADTVRFVCMSSCIDFPG